MPIAAPQTRIQGPRPAPGLELVRIITTTWRDAGRASTVRSALDAIAEGARRSVGGAAASIALCPDDAASEKGLLGAGPTPGSDPSTVSISIVGSGRRALGSLTVDAAPGRGPITAEDRSILEAFLMMAAAVIERTAVQRNLQAVLDHSPVAIFLKDRELRYVIANRRAAELVGRTRGEELLGRRDDELMPAADAARVMTSDLEILNGHGDVDVEEAAHWPLEGRRFHVQAFGVRDEHGAPMGVGGVVSVITEHRTANAALVASEARYRMLFEHALDAVFFTDDAGRYVEANPAACELVGRSRDEILMRSVTDDVVVGSSGGPISDAMWAAFLSGDGESEAGPLVRGDLSLRRSDGSIRVAEYRSAANVAPGLHVGVLRDVTEQRISERREDQRHAILGCLLAMPTQAPLDEQADAVCGEIASRGEFQQAAIFALEPPRRLLLLGSAGTGTQGGQTGATVLEGERAATVLVRATSGPWIDSWVDAPAGPLEAFPGATGVAGVAWAPIRADGRVIALLAVGASMATSALTERLPDIEELASIVAGSALGRSLRERASVVASSLRIRRIIEEGAFHPVFQAIVDLETGEPLGYEALTRFDDGAPPEAVFAEAAASGVSLELEIATAQAAMHAAGPLPANRFIDINVSPELVVAREPLRTMVREWGFGVVLEITEHDEVADYAAVRAAIADIGLNVRLAVDDAGAGFASLRHILELRPAMVKLDRTLVAGIDGDPARQALVAGMVHFAGRLRFDLIAEGVETEAERTMLLDLGVTRAQGYLFGRPVPVDRLGRQCAPRPIMPGP
ncbi:MAG: EAL domain-containing protein [Chloroflexi bacterium]|nr:EAL domain-containing protein [Chloroflexota bacterium]